MGKALSRVKRLFVVIALASGLILCVANPLSVQAATPAISMNPTSGVPGICRVTVSGSGFSDSEIDIAVTYDVTYDNTLVVVQGITADSQGSWTAVFLVPASAADLPHSISAYGSVTPKASVTNLKFTVTPGIFISRPSVAAGTSVTVTGSGFYASETGITVTMDGVIVAQGITANSQGGWSAPVPLAALASGSHGISAYGSVTKATSVPSISSTITPVISASQSSGPPGGRVIVSGSGFGANEEDIAVTYDSTPVAQGITADSQGSWYAPFVIPASASGSHSIGAYGSDTPQASVPTRNFTVTPDIAISRASGSVGTSVTVSGSGFYAGEKGITVTMDGATVAQGMTADPNGSWSAVFVMPDSVSGFHSIGAYGSLTQAATVAEVSFNIGSAVSISPDYGSVGETVSVTGSGFAVNSPLSFVYDGQDIPAGGSITDSSGSFSESITIPRSVNGRHTITVSDDQNNNSKVTFNMENTPPAVPRLLSPGDGTRVGLPGEIKPTFKWTGVTDPSGVTYILEVDTSPEFLQPILRITDINGSSYALTSAQALSGGEYYWRVEAVDGASNESGWSQPWSFKPGVMASWTLITIIIFGVMAVGIVAYFLTVRLRRRRTQFISVPEVDISEVIPGRLRLPEADVATGEQTWPRRLALPHPTKRGKTLSAEEMARLKVILDFAQSLPFAGPGYTANWLVDLLQSSMGVEVSALVYEQLLKGEVQVYYYPAWMRHPTYQDLTTLLQGQPILQDLNAFVDLVNRCASEATGLLQEIYRDTISEIIPSDFLSRGGWEFISAIYSDALSWFRGKSLRAPAERDYNLKRKGRSRVLWLCGEEDTSFAVPLISVHNENEASVARTLHLKLRRTYRNSDRAKQLASLMTQVEVQRDRLVNAFSQASGQFTRFIQ